MVNCRGDQLAQAIARHVGQAIETRPCDRESTHRVVVLRDDQGVEVRLAAEVCQFCEDGARALRGFYDSYPIRH